MTEFEEKKRIRDAASAALRGPGKSKKAVMELEGFGPSATVIELETITTLDIPPDKILTKATGKLKEAIVMGWDRDDNLYFASSKADGGDCNWLIDKCKMALLEAGEE